MKLSDLYPWKVGSLLRRYVKAHHVSRAVLIAAGTAAAILFFVIGAAIRLLIGPVSLGPFAGTLANALAEALPFIVGGFHALPSSDASPKAPRAKPRLARAAGVKPR